MKKIICFFIVIITGINTLFSQIQISNNNMPVPNDHYYCSTSLLTTVNYENGGENLIWDFSKLIATGNRTDTFVSFNSVPAVYKLVFFNQATVAAPINTFNLIPNLELKDAYFFYKNSTKNYIETGIGASLNGIPIPVKYDKADIIYTFPVKYGNVDSSNSSFKFSLPNVIYFSQIKKRKNYTDAWGTIITLYGSFQALRVKSVIYEKDSIFLDTLGLPIPAIIRNYTEYKWLTNNFHIPVLQITKEALVTNIVYIDSIPKVTNITDKNNDGFFNIFPNPCNDLLTINYYLSEPGEIKISINDITGRTFLNSFRIKDKSGFITETIKLDRILFQQGIYILNIQTANDLRRYKFVVN
ncbi:MAG: T9SS type A sorting domain-containing protein [Bacteroidales bacterium]|nr:T9SS type A sorting domain-containing protein [Bacteroidales bacterium]